MREDFCTYFDSNYLPRGLALYRSLHSFRPSARWWVLCLDAAAFAALMDLRLPNVVPISIEDFEAADERLAGCRLNRPRVEYYFTCTPCLPRYVFARWPAVESLTYLDADLFFYADPGPLFDEIGDGQVAIVPHRFSRHLRDRERFGLYNVGWITFRAGPVSAACLSRWREQCIVSCTVDEESGLYGDQKYLDDWPALSTSVRVIQHKGANVAPWNVSNYTVSCRDGRVLVDAEPLLFFHFSHLRKSWGPFYNLGLHDCGVRPTRALLRLVCEPYLRALQRETSKCNLPATTFAALRPVSSAEPLPWLHNVADKAWARLRFARGLARREHVALVGGRII